MGTVHTWEFQILTSVGFAIWATIFRIETLSFQILLAGLQLIIYQQLLLYQQWYNLTNVMYKFVLYSPSNWSIGCGNYAIKLQPIGRQLPRGNRMQSISWWTIHSNRLRNMLCHLPKRMGCCQTICRNRHMWNIRDGNVCQWHSSNRPKL